MPNDCYNQLKINGPLETLIDFRNRAITIEDYDEINLLDFENFYPAPENVDWYDWNIKHWGTKWSAYDIDNYIEPEQEGDYLSYSFFTAWSPPTGWLQKVSELYPDLTFEMESEESGMDYYGKLTIINGILHIFECSYVDYIYCKFDGEDVVNNLMITLLDYPKEIEGLFRDEYYEFENKILIDILGNCETIRYTINEILKEKIEIAKRMFNKWKILTKLRIFLRNNTKKYYDMTLHELKLKKRDQDLGLNKGIKLLC